jgi:hypothetical protein
MLFSSSTQPNQNACGSSLLHSSSGDLQTEKPVRISFDILAKNRRVPLPLRIAFLFEYSEAIYRNNIVKEY